ncbi:MAG TPA: tRNA dihydrouridine synthase DusB [Nevskiaceae bacterium]|nr:tRNA dihydrouridine synthase DusB [Nevskiaceae bacterium]
MRIGPYRVDPPLVLAPMAGVTDRPFRSLCRAQGAGLVVSEMTTSDETLWHTDKSRLRRDHAGESAPIAVQIAGTEPEAMARAARFNVEHGAQIVDINMGCPAKKVCRVDAGSALMRDEALVGRILNAVVAAVDVPVTLKIRTGWARTHRNAVAIARIAQDSGIAALAVHGRTREDHYEGRAEYETIAAVKRSVAIPVMANGDIVDGASARAVLEATGVNALMIGRAAQGRPWIFRQIATYLATGVAPPEPSMTEAGRILLHHLDDLHAFYGEGRGVRVARKHIQWYCQSHAGSEAFWSSINQVACAKEQRSRVEAFFFGDARLPRAA